MDEIQFIKTCRICGDEATGRHFGGYTCAACAAFFRRSIAGHKRYRCATSDKRLCSIIHGKKKDKFLDTVNAQTIYSKGCFVKRERISFLIIANDGFIIPRRHLLRYTLNNVSVHEKGIIPSRGTETEIGISNYSRVSFWHERWRKANTTDDDRKLYFYY